MFSLGGDNILPRNLKNRVKSVIDDQELILASENWGFQMLTSLDKQSKNQALAQNAKRALFRVNGVLLKAQRGAFWKSVQRKL